MSDAARNRVSKLTDRTTSAEQFATDILQRATIETSLVRCGEIPGELVESRERWSNERNFSRKNALAAASTRFSVSVGKAKTMNTPHTSFDDKH